MGKLLAPFQFVGNVNGLSFYKMKGHDKVIMRRGGGPTKEYILESPKMINTRNSIAEFGARSNAAKIIKVGLPRGLAGRNIIGPLNGLLREVQLLDDKNGFGQRNVCLSKHGEILEGFELSTITSLNSIIKKPIEVKISRAKLSATIQVPAFKPPKSSHPWWRVETSFFLVPDIVYEKKEFKKVAEPGSIMIDSEWQKTGETFKAQKFQLQLKLKPASTSYLLVTAVGFRFGYNGRKNIEWVNGEGAGRIVKVG